MTSSSTSAALLRSMHTPGSPLLLPNVWDAGTARLVVAAGFPAVATSSGAVAGTLGFNDHQDAPADLMLAAAARIAAAVEVPVTVDAEGGYGLEPAELAQRLLDLGATGANVEDTDHARGGLRPVAEAAAYLAGMRAAAGDALVLNARIDVFYDHRLRQTGVAQADLLDEALVRARAYLEAGADCVYPILLADPATARAFVEALDAPVNLLALPEALELEVARDVGAARISLGTTLWRAQQAWLRDVLTGLTGGTLPS
jgi:2-methylisocitrate lyase-like PEP mutase family enzyme